MTVIYKEIEAFNRGERETIFILKSSLSDVKHLCYFITVSEGVLVSRTPKTIWEYMELNDAVNEDYALGIVLGFPPKCVEWFAKASGTEREICPVFVFESFSFKCPPELNEYATDYYAGKLEVSK